MSMTKDKARLLLLGTAGGASGGGGSSPDPDKQAASLVLYCQGGGRHDATKIVAKQGGSTKPTDLSYAFAFCESATQFDLSGLDLSVVTKIKGIFQNCTALTAGVLPAVEVEGLQEVFNSCANLTSADFTAVSAKEGSNFQLTNAANLAVLQECPASVWATLHFTRGNGFASGSGYERLMPDASLTAWAYRADLVFSCTSAAFNNA